MDSMKPISSTNHFTRKKILVSYILSVFVFWIHCASFANYEGAPVWFQKFCWLFEYILPSVGVPLFFMISGALFFRSYTNASWTEKLKRRIHTLLIPYFCWNFLMLLFQIVTTIFLAKYFLMRIPFDFTLRSFLAGLFHWKYNNPFWYVFSLMMFALAAPLLDLLLKTRCTAVLSILTLLILSQFGMGLPEPFFYDRTCIVYYLVGGFLGRFCWDAVAADTGRKHLPAALAGIGIALVQQYLQLIGTIPDVPILTVPAMMLYAVCLWIAADAMLEIVTVRSYMQHSFWVYAMHMNVAAIFTKLLYLALPKQWGWAMPNFLLTTALTLVSIEICCQILKKWFPPIYRLLGGDR